ncbi:MAG: transcription initiation factor IIB [Sclerophora amabilis]|nr:MAG: transcription initiation factor IIB [Sclerophora amabilis]
MADAGVIPHGGMVPGTSTPPTDPAAGITDPSAASKARREWQENLNMTMMCRECKEFPPNLVEEFSSGDMVCGSCGLVLGDRVVDTRSEWRTFSNDDQGGDDPSRVGDGANRLYKGSQLQTSIAYGDAGSIRHRELHRAQNKSTFDKSNKALTAAYSEIDSFCAAFGLESGSPVNETAKYLFMLIDDARAIAFRSKPQEVLTAGCIFIACRKCNVPRTFREIFAVTRVPKKEIGKIFKLLEKFFAAQNQEKMALVEQKGGFVNPVDSYVSTTSTSPKDLCIRFCSNLGLKPPCTMVAEELAEQMSTVGALAGRSPLSAAAACIYMASYLMKQRRSPKEISQVAGVSDGTIRTAYKFIYAQREKLIKPEWIKDGRGDMRLLPPS